MNLQRFAMSPEDVPGLLIKALDDQRLQRLLAHLNRTRRMLIGFGLNGMTVMIPRRQARDAVAGELAARVAIGTGPRL
jgi:hypothetical protein